jgi:hypothetical protein
VEEQADLDAAIEASVVYPDDDDTEQKAHPCGAAQGEGEDSTGDVVTETKLQMLEAATGCSVRLYVCGCVYNICDVFVCVCVCNYLCLFPRTVLSNSFNSP